MEKIFLATLFSKVLMDDHIGTHIKQLSEILKHGKLYTENCSYLSKSTLSQKAIIEKDSTVATILFFPKRCVFINIVSTIATPNAHDVMNTLQKRKKYALPKIQMRILKNEDY